MKKMNGKPLLLALCLAAALLLASCGPKPAPSQGSSQDASQSASGDSSSAADSSSGDSSSDSSASVEEEEEHTLMGTVNVLDSGLDLLVLVNNGTYYKFDTAKVDLSGLAPGDDVSVTYTGTLDPDDPDSMGVLVSFSKYAD